MYDLKKIQKAIQKEQLDGWLFCNFQHRDSLTDSLLSLNSTSVSSRRWFYHIPAHGIPLKIVHSIEQEILDSLEGDKIIYSTKVELVSILALFAGQKTAVLVDHDIQILSSMDASSWNLLLDSKILTCTAAPLIQRIKGTLSPEDIKTHEFAADILYTLVSDSWQIVTKAFLQNNPVYEGDIQDFMLARFNQTGLITDHPPIVAAGKASGDPHYSVPGIPFTEKKRGNRLKKNDVVQFDLWAKQKNGIYADISWIGYCGTSIPKDVETAFTGVINARNLVITKLQTAFAQNIAIVGAEIDADVRSFLLSAFPSSAVRHRTGHGIDRECHGSGVNLDSVEFPDYRQIIEGSCFSVEPGLYFETFGFRSEINIYILNNTPVVSGKKIQESFLIL